MYLIEVFVTNASLNVNKLFSYYYEDFIETFKRVEIVFNRSKNQGLVVNCKDIGDLKEYENKVGYRLLKINKVIDDSPIISSYQFELAKWLSKTTLSPFISCLNSMLPKQLRTSKNIKNKVYVEKIIKHENIDYPFTLKQKALFDKLYDGMLAKDARKLSLSIFNKLLENNLIELYEEEKKYTEEKINHTSFKTLTTEQKFVYDSLLNTDKLTSLLFGVTGSGKTEVYLHLAKHYLALKKQVLILVPEISLTPQMIKRVKERFDNVVFYHSELNDQERYEQYMRVKNDEVNIVVGTRSSVFLPFNNLGLIIVDEEHDNSYKQDNSPCYSAINVAKKIASDLNAKVLLASATPSLDSFSRAKKNEYNFLTLKHRINDSLPDIKIVDLNVSLKKENNYIISKELEKELSINLKNKKQSIILLNRRGYSPIIKCSECSSILQCSSCDIPLSYHKDENVLKCHECGRVYKVVNTCPKCNSHKLIYYGFGTKKVEEKLKELFPFANIDRMDKDSVTKKGSHARILNKLENHETDILIGTQMISKGLDYPDVTLVGILNADAGLMKQDYNSAKITFDLLMQASGRSGRADCEGKVIIQAFNPEHYVLKSVLKQDYEYFYNIEMNYRNKMKYPPYSHMVEYILQDANATRLNKSVDYIFNNLSKFDFKLYKPLSLNKINNLNRTRILAIDPSIIKLLDSSWDIVSSYLSTNNMSKIKVEVDPLYLE